jgi:acyl-coenzyme A synthetase/AMP-(fatty) acid ligase
LFYQAKEQNDKEVVLCLKKFLPRFMIPNRFVFLKSIPMNKNAKIDRQKLKSEFIDETS